jgi:hypothetical protein
MSGSSYYIKNMNGIISLSDGQGTEISDDAITSDVINCTTLNASSTVITDYINATNSSQLGIKNNTLITGSLTTTNGVQTAYLEGRGIGGVGSPLSIGQSNDYTSYVNVGRAEFTAGGYVFPAIPVRTTYIPTSSYDLCNKLYVDNATAGTSILSLANTFTGTSNTFNNKIVVGTTTIQNNQITVSGTDSFFVLGESNSNVLIANSRTSGYVAIGGTAGGCQTITNGTLLCHNGINLDRSTNFINCDATATINLFDNLTTGFVNICKNITSGAVNLCNSIVVTPLTIASGATTDIVNLFNNINGSIGKIRMATNLIISQGAINCSSVTDSIRLFKTITTGKLYICESLTTLGTVLIGGTGVVKLCNIFQFLTNNPGNSDDIQYIGSKNKIEVFNDLNTTNTLNIGGTSTINIGSVSALEQGTVNINSKLNIGTNGTVFRCMIMGKIGAGVIPLTNYTIPGAPTTFGNPILFTTINANMSGNLYCVMTNVTGPNTFQYWKRFWTGSATVDASVESFNYMAVWL